MRKDSVQRYTFMMQADQSMPKNISYEDPMKSTVLSTSSYIPSMHFQTACIFPTCPLDPINCLYCECGIKKQCRLSLLNALKSLKTVQGTTESL